MQAKRVSSWTLWGENIETYMIHTFEKSFFLNIGENIETYAIENLKFNLPSPNDQS